MMANAEAARSVCEVTPEEEKALSDPARPIVLLKKRRGVALAAGLAGSRDLAEAMAFGTAAAAITVTRVGAQQSIPTLDEVRSALA